MKRKLNVIKITVIFLLILGINSLVYATGRFVDIPVPPNDKGNAGYSPEDGENKSQEYKEQQEKNNKTAEDFVEKSSNNNLKNIEIQGFKLEPEFNSQTYDYELKIDKNKVKKINVNAEPEDTKSKVEGDGTIEINEQNDIVNINVIAENGNLKVYTIRIVEEKSTSDVNTETEKDIEDNTFENEENITIEQKKGDNKININIIIILIVIIALIIIFNIFKNTNKNKGIKQNRKGKHNKD